MFSSKRNFDDFSEELRAHIALEADRLRQEGLSEEEAWAAARRNVGDRIKAGERFYESTRWMWLEHLSQDLRYAFRQLFKNKAFTFVVILTLALGIGANTAIFSLIHAVMLTSLPVANPQQLYRLGAGHNCCVLSGTQGNFSIFSYSLYKQLRDHTPEFEELAAFQADIQACGVQRAGDSEPAQAFKANFVSGNYFSTFGVRPAAGRLISPSDDNPQAPRIAVLSYRAWQHFGLDPTLIGSALTIDGTSVTVAGVTTPEFYGETLREDPPELWMPLSAEPAIRAQSSLLERPDQFWLYSIGRLKPGFQPANVEAEVNVELQQWFGAELGSRLSAKERASAARQHIRVVSAAAGVTRMQKDYANALRVLIAASALVLLIACANIANLLLARGTASRLQSSIRLALGAARNRILRQSLTESILLALLGGLVGLFVAAVGASAIVLLAFRGARFVPINTDPSLPVLGFTFLLSLLTGVIFGAAPAWITTRLDPAEALRGANRSTGNRSTLPQQSLVVLQAALSLMLLASAGSLTESLRNLEHQRFGFETQGRLNVRVNSGFSSYSPERLAALYRQLPDRLRQVPGVMSASFALYSPMRGSNWSSGISIEGQAVAGSQADRAWASWDRVSPRFFETIGTPLVRGRLIDERDTPASPRIAVINQTLADKYFKDQNPIGHHLGIGGPESSNDYEIVGIAGDAKFTDAREEQYPMIFLPFLQMRPDDWSDSGRARSNFLQDIQVRYSGNPQNLEPEIRKAIASVDSHITVLRIATFADQLSMNFNQDRLLARLTSLFSLVALLLASVGVYGLMAYSVARRTTEIGLRMALGAARGNVVGLILRGASIQVGLGLLIGIPAVLASGRFLEAQLYGIKPNNPLMLAAATLILVVCALTAGLIPAFRAAGIDPLRALRSE
ncbi:MAG TPA: ABC transporter permease [Bryobacteraceae bacterium]|nr:ABC transporter permease [Bryobacteraceae bacterium]